MRTALLVACALFPCFLFSQQIEKHIKFGGEKIGFWEYKPGTYASDKSTKYPLIIFLHGIGERGNGTSELYKVKKIGIPAYINRGEKMRFYKNGAWHTFIVLSPQCPNRYGMWPTSYVDAMIDYAENNLRIDRNRIYLTGLSMGGGGTWRWASASEKNAKKVAAIATVCAPDWLTNGCNIARASLPMWSFHATNDPIVRVSIITSAINRVLRCSPAVRPLKTVWSSGGHAIWDKAYDTKHNYQSPNVFEWFLGYSRGSKSTNGVSKPAPVKVAGRNQAPVANAGSDLQVHLPFTSALLVGTRSYDKDGWIRSFRWSKVSGPGGSSFGNVKAGSTRVYGLAAGTYHFRLTVVDGKGSTSYDDVFVRVDKPPVVITNGQRLTYLPTNRTTLMAYKSYDPDPNGWIKSFKWTKISGPSKFRIASPGSPSTVVNNLAAGDYLFRVTVTDGSGNVSWKNMRVSVRQPARVASSAVLEVEQEAVAAPVPVIANSAKLSLYPNPAKSFITVSCNAEKSGRASVTIFDVSGKQLMTSIFDKDIALLQRNIDISTLNKGVYVLTVNIDGSPVSTQRFIKE